MPLCRPVQRDISKTSLENQEKCRDVFALQHMGANSCFLLDTIPFFKKIGYVLNYFLLTLSSWINDFGNILETWDKIERNFSSFVGSTEKKLFELRAYHFLWLKHVLLRRHLLLRIVERSWASEPHVNLRANYSIDHGSFNYGPWMSRLKFLICFLGTKLRIPRSILWSRRWLTLKPQLSVAFPSTIMYVNFHFFSSSLRISSFYNYLLNESPIISVWLIPIFYKCQIISNSHI